MNTNEMQEEDAAEAQQQIEALAATFGGKAVGLSFNPRGDVCVTAAKCYFADAINMANDLRNFTDDPEVRRMCSVAITEAQTAQMWLVKALTWKR